MFIKQLSVFVENKPGRMADIAALLADSGIDIRALSVADTTNFGILRLIVDQPDRAEEALKAAGMTVSLNNVVGIAVPDAPGGFASAMKLLAEEGVGIEYMYAFISHDRDTANVVLRAEDNRRLLDALKKGGINTLQPDELYK